MNNERREPLSATDILMRRYGYLRQRERLSIEEVEGILREEGYMEQYIPVLSQRLLKRIREGKAE